MTDLEKLKNLLENILDINFPILSGNMYRHGVEIVSASDNEITLCIDAPFYDAKKWRESGAIIPTGESFNGITSYAMWVNKVGAFGRHNKSEHWVNRACFEAVNTLANEIGAEVENELEL